MESYPLNVNLESNYTFREGVFGILGDLIFLSLLCLKASNSLPYCEFLNKAGAEKPIA